MDKQRYFYITYLHTGGFGSIIEDGYLYPNEQKVFELIKHQTGICEVLITNIIEMSKEDFEQFNKGK